MHCEAVVAFDPAFSNGEGFFEAQFAKETTLSLISRAGRGLVRVLLSFPFEVDLPPLLEGVKVELVSLPRGSSFGAFVNKALERVSPEASAVAILSHRAKVVLGEWLERLTTPLFFGEEPFWATGPLLDYPIGDQWEGAEREGEGPWETNFLSKHFMVLRGEALRRLGKFPEEGRLAGAEDLDLCIRILVLGGRLAVVGEVRVDLGPPPASPKGLPFPWKGKEGLKEKWGWKADLASHGPSAIRALLRIGRLELAVSLTRRWRASGVKVDFENFVGGLLLSGRFEEARRAISLLEEAFGEEAFVLNLKGLLAEAERLPEEARRCFEEAHRKAPVWAPPIKNLGLLAIKKGNLREALALLEKAFLLNPSDKATFDLLVSLGKKLRRPKVVIPPQPTISLCMIAKDEAQNLPECISSFRGAFDQFILVDTGSSDGTPEIARALGAEVHFFKWREDFSSARNFSLSKAKCSWILVVDADDRLEPGGAEEIRRLARDFNFHAYLLRQEILFRSDPWGPRRVVLYKPRLFRNLPQFRFEGAIHEDIFPSIQRAGGKARLAEVTIKHVGYLSSEVLMEKLERNLRILLKERARSPSPRIDSYIGRTLMDMGRSEEAVKWLERSTEAMSPLDPSFVPSVLALSKALSLLGKVGKAISSLKRAISRLHLFGPLWLALGEAWERTANWEEARKAYFSALLCPPEPLPLWVEEDFPFEALLRMGLLYFKFGQFKEAREWLERAVSDFPKAKEPLVLLALLFSLEGKVRETEETLRRAKGVEGGWALLERCARAKVLSLKGRKQEALKLLREIHPEPAAPPVAFLLWGEVAYECGNLKEAEEALRKALEMDPSFIQARNDLAVVLFEQGRVREAITQLRTVLALAPGFELAKENLFLIARVLNGKSEE